MPEIRRPFSFDTGIERITTQQAGLPSLNLPHAEQTLPGDGIYEQRLVEVLTPPSVEQELAESFRPQVDHRDVLTPVGYQTALHESRRELKEMLEQLPAGPEREIVAAAAERLHDEVSLRDLLYTYRNLLHQA